MSERELSELREKDFRAFAMLMNPFPGLRPFSVEESHLFFGREGQSDEVLTKLADNKFVSILGTSGSGKSSLMYCGLIPILHGGFMTEAGSEWRICVSRPGSSPIDNLAEGLLMKDEEYASLSEDDKQVRQAITSTVMRSSSLGLIEAVKQMRKSPHENFLILVDQFEELFRYNKATSRENEANESLAFVNLLLEAIDQSEEPIYVALTMRSDFIGDCAQFQELTQKINDSHYLIPQMSREQKRLAIEGPVAVGGGEIAHRLVQQILNDVGDNPDQLPIMQHALMRTWSYWAEHHLEGEPMDLKHYNAIGRLSDALSNHANEAYDELSKRQKNICEIMFKALTESGQETVGIRRPTPLGTIAKIAGVSEDEVVEVIDKFREPGRTLLMPPHGVKLQSDTVIDISHESLMRNWTRLKTWVTEEAASAQMYLKLAEAAEAYQSGRAGLWRMPDLQLAINWREEHKPTLVWGQRYHPAFERTMVFLKTSEEAYITEQENKERIQRRNLRRARAWAIGLGVFGIVAIFLVVFARQQAAEAEKQQKAAEAAQAEAIENAEEAQRQAEIAEEQRHQAEQAREDAVEAQKETELALEKAQIAEANAREQQRLAEQSAAIARREQARAERQTEIAEEQRAEAQRQEQIAVEQREAAERLRFQSIAKSMAVKSLQMEDTMGRGVIALQAYKFNQQFEGSRYDPDIYNAIFAAFQLLTHDSINHLKGHTASVRAMSYTNSGQHLYTASSSGSLLRWEMDEQGKSYENIFSSVHPIRALSISPDDRYLVAGDQDATIQIIDLDNINGEPNLLEGHTEDVLDIEFLPDGTGFVSTSLDRTVRFSDLQQLTTIAENKSIVRVIAVSPDNKIIAGGTEDGIIKLWDRDSDFSESQLDITLPTGVFGLEFSHNGKYLAAGEASGRILIWDTEENTQFVELTGHNARVSDIEFSNDDQLMSTSSWDQTAHIYDMNNIFNLPIELTDHNQWLWGVAFSPDASLLITGSNDEIVREWPTDIGEYAEEFCDLLERNMTQREWIQYVGEDIDYRVTCDNLPAAN